ncbi:MAG TPA: hypothetical protein VE861_16450 [Gemmatimonadaceae bacterium]|nr:hypothetical protein [Gemmatimonadaceae bacterium]
MRTRPFIIATFAVITSACSQQDKRPRVNEDSVVGLWISDTLIGTDAARRLYRLRMARGGMAELSSAVVGSAPVVERGTWDGADSLVRVVVRGASTASRPSSILLAVRGTRLGMVSFDTTAWGPRGLTLYRQAGPADSATP